MLKESILQHFWPSLSYRLTLRPLFCLLLSCCLRQVLLYLEKCKNVLFVLFPITRYGPWRKKICLWGFVNNKGADQPVHLCSLISALLESIISKLATSKISIFKLDSIAEETGLSLDMSATPKTGFVASRPIYCGSFKALYPAINEHFSSNTNNQNL